MHVPEEEAASYTQAKTVVFVHGQPGLGSDFSDVARLLDVDHRILAPDRPGYGDNPSGPVSMRENAGWLAELIEEHGEGPVTVVGHSYGGGIAVLLSAARPDLVSGLVLAASVGEEKSLGVVDHLLALPFLGEFLSAAGLSTLYRVLPRLRRFESIAPRDFVDHLHASLPDPGYLEGAARRKRQISRSFVFEQRSLIRELPSIEDALRDIATPAVVVTGSWDVVVPPSVAGRVAESLANSELITVDRVGHFLLRDAPEVIANAVRSVERAADLEDEESDSVGS